MSTNQIVLKGKGHFLELESVDSDGVPIPGRAFSRNGVDYAAIPYVLASGLPKGGLCFALPRASMGGTVNENGGYLTRFPFYVPVAGDELQVRIKKSTTIAEGDLLVLDTSQKHTFLPQAWAATTPAYAIALESAVSSSTDEALCRVMIL